jgi:hypothetical protein
MGYAAVIHGRPGNSAAVHQALGASPAIASCLVHPMGLCGARAAI